MVREFKKGEVLAKLFFHLLTSPSSRWRRLEIAGSLQDWLEERRDFFSDPRIHHTIEAERQTALGEIAASMRRSPGPSSIRLSTEAQHGFPTPNPVPGPVPEEFMEEWPPHPDPVPSSVPEGSQAEPPSHSVPVREGLVDGLAPLPVPVPGSVLEGSEDELSPSLIAIPEEFVEDLSPLPVPVPEGCEDAPSPPAVSWWLRRRSPRHCRRSQRSLQRSLGSPGPAAGRQIIGCYVTGLLIACPYFASPLIGGLARDSPLIGRSAGDGHRSDRLIARSAGDSHRSGCLNSGSAGAGLWACRLNSHPPSKVPSARPCRVVLFLVLVLLPSTPRPTLVELLCF
ncbi:hypothetical protein AMECASPLE_025386 [Ameca splendens]|uniref:Uncharacterized protein n=1 Tax=Ameca splendens TaxID=208324 RepID=A0ABV0XHK1_9TELE